LGKHIDPGGEPLARSTGAPLWARRAALIVGLAFIGSGAVLTGFAAMKHENPIQYIQQTFVPSPETVFGKPNLLVLVEGLDYDYTANDIEFSTNSRSDMIKAINLDFEGKSAYVLSVLRDMEATYPDGSIRKINEAQSDGGPKEAQAVIARFLGIPGFDRYAVLRVDATKDLIDAIGGVDLYVKDSDCLANHTGCTGGRIDYDDSWGHLHVHLTEGMHHLNGPQAVAYGRFRHDWCSDPCRVMRQDQVIMAALNKLRGDKLNTLVHAGDIMKVVHKDIETNFTQDEIVSLASYFSNLSLANVHFDKTPYVGDEERADGDDLVPDKVALAQLVQNTLIAPPTPEPSPDAMALAAIAPATLRVDVENASGVNGAAKLVATLLRKAGFIVGDVGNAATSDQEKTEIREHSKVTFAGAKVRAALPIPATARILTDATTSPASPEPSDVTVIVGKDLAAAAAVSASPSVSQ
jgi:polyisoprenyl-teichoic acid--peptidoglycan teichoic acid transferase